MHTSTYIRTHTHTHPRTHARTHAHTHTHTHTHTLEMRQNRLQEYQCIMSKASYDTAIYHCLKVLEALADMITSQLKANKIISSGSYESMTITIVYKVFLTTIFCKMSISKFYP